MIRSRFLFFLLPLLTLSPVLLTAQDSSQSSDSSATPAPLTPQQDGTPLPEMAEIEQAWAQGDFGFVRTGLQRLAEQTGTALAQYRYGRVLLEGRGGPRDLAGAQLWLEKAAAQRHAEAETLLARLLLSAPRDSASYDPARGAALFERAAARGQSEAQYYLGLMLREGTGVAADPEAAFTWFLAAAEQQYVAAQFELSRAYSRGQGTAQDGTAALKWLTEAATGGHVEAMFFLAHALDTGQGAPLNRGEAVSWLRRAAEADHVASQRTLGRKYLLAEGVAANPEEALRWLGAAAAREDSFAMTLMGQAYMGEAGIAPDPDLAWSWYRRASEYGEGRATAALAGMLETGIGREVDVAAAVLLYRKALDQGFDGAMIALGHMAGAGTLTGHAAPHTAVPWALAAATEGDVAALDWLRAQADAGIRPAQSAMAFWLVQLEDDPSAAMPYFEAAASRGDVGAQHQLGMMLTRGEGTAQDYVAGHAWLNIAAASGHAEAIQMRATVSELMTPEQVAAAQAVARHFFEQAARTVPVESVPVGEGQ